jgi:hypothetical protein
MRKRILTVAVGAVLCAGIVAGAQTALFTVRADKIEREVAWGVGGQTAPVPVQSTLTGNVVLTVNGVLVRADRAVIKDGEVALEGNVRLTLPLTK